MNDIFIGIDAGMRGAFAIIYPDHQRLFPIPYLEDENIDTFRIVGDLPFNDFNNVFVYIEKVWRPVSLVRNAGILEGIMLVNDLPVYRVAPSTWRKEILGNSHATKEDAINYCLENFPDINLLRTKKSRVPDHNFAEALLIAEYAKRKHSSNDNG